MYYKVTIEKLKKGWMTTFNAPSKDKGRKLSAMIASVSNGIRGIDMSNKKYATKLSSNGSKAYKVSQYRSKLRQVNQMVYDLFKQVRDTGETCSVPRRARGN